MNGRAARGPCRCSQRARTLLPVPVSPSMRTGGRRRSSRRSVGEDRLELRAHGVQAPAEKDPVGLVGRLRGAVLLAPRGAAGAAAAEERQRQFLGLERLGQVVARAEAHGLDGLATPPKAVMTTTPVFSENAPSRSSSSASPSGRCRSTSANSKRSSRSRRRASARRGRLGHLGAEAAQVGGEPFAQGGIVLEQENLAAGGKRGFHRHPAP